MTIHDFRAHPFSRALLITCDSPACPHTTMPSQAHDWLCVEPLPAGIDVVPLGHFCSVRCLAAWSDTRSGG